MDASRHEPRFSQDIPPGATARDIRRKLYEREQRGAEPQMAPGAGATPPPQRTADQSEAVGKRHAARR